MGHSDLGGKTRVTLLWTGGILDFYDVARCLFGGVGLVGKEKRSSRTLGANWESLMRWTGRRSGLRWTPVNARDRAGPATLGSHGGGATRRLGVTGLIDTNLKEATGRARTVRYNYRSSNTLYCRVNVLVNDGSDETRARLL